MALGSRPPGALGDSWSPEILETYSTATAAAVTAGDGGGVDGYFRNSGVVISADGLSFWAVNGVHPVDRRDYTSYYPKSVIRARLADDSIELRCPFYGASSDSAASAVGGAIVTHELDMEALSVGPDGGESYLYIGDEYNFVYEMRIADCEISRQWDLSAIVGDVATDKGIEALAYSQHTGLFYAGIQGTATVHAVSLAGVGVDDDGSGCAVDCAAAGAGSFATAASPSGLFYDAASQALYVFMGTSTNGYQGLSAYLESDGSLACELTIPASVGIARGDGFFLSADSSAAYIADSQGPMWSSSLGGNLYKVAWTDPCGLAGVGPVAGSAAPSVSPPPTPLTLPPTPSPIVTSSGNSNSPGSTPEEQVSSSYGALVSPLAPRTLAMAMLVSAGLLRR